MILRNEQGPRIERDGVRRLIHRVDRSIAARGRQHATIHPSGQPSTHDTESSIPSLPDEVDLSQDSFFAGIPSLPTGDGGVGSSSRAGDGGIGSSYPLPMDYEFVNSAFFGSCMEEFAASVNEDDATSSDENDEPPVQQDAPARQEPPVQQDAPARQEPPVQQVPVQQAVPDAPLEAAPAVDRDPALPPGDILSSYVDHRGYYILTHPEEAVRGSDVMTVRRRAVHMRRFDAFIYDCDATCGSSLRCLHL